MAGPHDDLDALEQYFGPGLAASEHSTFGSMLDAASKAYRGSDGKVHDMRRVRTVTRELEGSTMANPRFAQVTTGWATMLVKKEQGGSGAAPESRDDQLQLVARVGRRLEQLEPHLVGALEVLYGDRGCRWANEKQGRIWALAVRTQPARDALAADTEKRLRKVAKQQAKGLAPDLTWQALRDDDRLAVLATAEPRPTWVDDALDQAERLQGQAEAAWARTAPPADDLEADEAAED